MAPLTASSASMEQWSFTGGKCKYFAITLLEIVTALSICLFL